MQSQWTVELTKKVWVDIQLAYEMSRSLDNIWKPKGYNCAIGSYGIIVATHAIKKREELLMNYGDDWAYWDGYKLTIVTAMARLL
jgi:hypothetical protein